MTVLQIVLAAICVVVAGWLVVLIVLDRLPGDLLYGVLAVVEIGLVAQLVIGLVRVFGDHGDLNVAAYVDYLVGSCSSCRSRSSGRSASAPGRAPRSCWSVWWPSRSCSCACSS